MITLNDIIDVLSDNKLTHKEKSGWLHSNHITVQELIDAVNYVTIERNFYKHRCETTKNNDLRGIRIFQELGMTSPNMPTSPPCYAPNGICTNPQMDCISCPKRGTGGTWSTSTNTNKED